jgi:hypothetical protein
MVHKQLGRAHISQQHIDLILPRDFLHLRNAGARARRLGQEPRAQRMPPDRLGIEPDQPGVFLDQTCYRTIRHCNIGALTLRVDLKEQRARRPAPHLEPLRQPRDGLQNLAARHRNRLALALLVGLRMADGKLEPRFDERCRYGSKRDPAVSAQNLLILRNKFSVKGAPTGANRDPATNRFSSLNP